MCFTPGLSVLFRAAAILVVLTIVSFNAASVIDLHLHTLGDGRVVVHSHPVDKDDEGGSQHQHTANEYAVLNTLGKLLQVDNIWSGWTPVSIQSAVSCIEFFQEKIFSHLVAGMVDERSPPKITSA